MNSLFFSTSPYFFLLQLLFYLAILMFTLSSLKLKLRIPMLTIQFSVSRAFSAVDIHYCKMASTTFVFQYTAMDIVNCHQGGFVLITSKLNYIMLFIRTWAQQFGENNIALMMLRFNVKKKMGPYFSPQKFSYHHYKRPSCWSAGLTFTFPSEFPTLDLAPVTLTDCSGSINQHCLHQAKDRGQGTGRPMSGGTLRPLGTVREVDTTPTAGTR